MIYYFEKFDNGKFVEGFKKIFDVNNIKLHSQNVLHIYHDISKGKMFQDFQKSWKNFLSEKNVTQYSYNQNLILNLPHNTGVFEFFLCIIELLHPSLKNFFDNLNAYMVRVSPSWFPKSTECFCCQEKKQSGSW